MRIVWAMFVLAVFLAPAAQAEDAAIARDLARDLAPTGTLRAAINLGNAVLARKGADGALSGVSVDLARALSERIGVPLVLVPYDSAGAVSEAAASGAWDVCFLARDPKRAEGIVFTAPYLVIEGGYLVPAASPIRALDAVDRDGVRIAVGRGSAYDLYLSRTIRHATLVRARTSPAAIALFAESGLEVAANVRQPLEAYAAAHPQVRMLPGRFMEIAQAMGVPKGRDAGAAYLRRFVEAMKADGFVAKALDANGQAATVAPAE
ncbi:ABC transporter substrate-binding protein [Methylobacterium sp. WL8]|uniref:ABC transporter substrate-binding protein n=1 Tax=Methylobacterium sp. WL8 TaxID=2603899 RepID=UPI0011C91BF3|nr:ABC transporter substrate-binding protein [Methylobacterium sp. WL8]TXN83303.1 ABC transporter substrate-binding protein [Methylobacterium sp. WL8]